MPILTAEQKLLRDTLRELAEQRVKPLASEIDREGRFPHEAWESGAELGLLGMRAPEEFGGAGLGLTETCLAGEELAGVCMSTTITLLHQSNLVVDRLVDHGSREQQERLLPGLCDGSVKGCLAITEPGAGSDALGMRTVARRTAGGWLLNGSKTFITNGPVADLALVYAKIDDPDGRSLGLFVVDMNGPGAAKGRTLDKLGWRGSPTGELFFDDAFIPDENVIGEPGNGADILRSGLASERVLMGVQGVGMAQGALREAAAYAGERIQFGQPIGRFQLIQAKLADMYTGIELGRALAYDIAAQIDSAGDDGSFAVRAAACKLHGSELAMRAALEAVQIFGGYGYTTEYPVERFLRDAKIMEIGGGTSEIQRGIIGRSVLR